MRTWMGAATGILLLTVLPARAEILVTVDKSSQRMSVKVDGVHRYTWEVSTGLAGGPPNGRFRPQRLERSWFSRKFGNAPMPHSIFFLGGYAIHGTYDVRHLGRRASHGCVRLSPGHAATLFALVRREGASRTSIVVVGDAPRVAGSERRRVRRAGATP